MPKQKVYLYGMCSGVCHCHSTENTSAECSSSPGQEAQRKQAQPSSTTLAAGGVTVKRTRTEQQQEEDPLQPEPAMLPSGEDELSTSIWQVYQEHWSAIHTHHQIGQRVQDVYNYYIEDLNIHSLEDQLQQMFRSQTSRFKVNTSFGFII